MSYDRARLLRVVQRAIGWGVISVAADLLAVLFSVGFPVVCVAILTDLISARDAESAALALTAAGTLHLLLVLAMTWRKSVGVQQEDA